LKDIENGIAVVSKFPVSKLHVASCYLISVVGWCFSWTICSHIDHVSIN